MVGKSLDELAVPDEVAMPYVAVKEAVFPFAKLPNVDTLLGPEMRSTGEVMGIADSFGMAFAKAQMGADGALPLEGGILVTVNDHDKPTVTPIVRRFHEMGFRILATDGTARYLNARGIPAERVLKVSEGRPHPADLIVSGEVQLLINTPLRKLTRPPPLPPPFLPPAGVAVRVGVALYRAGRVWLTISRTKARTSTTAPGSAGAPRSGISAISCRAQQSGSGAAWGRT